MSDPTKLADAAAKVRSGAWDLRREVNYSHAAWEVILFHQRLASQRYMLPRMLSAAAKTCDAGGSASDPTTYLATTRFRQGGTPIYIATDQYRLRSVRVTSEDAQKLGPALFGPPFQPGADALASGPLGAALARSPFFMQQVAPNSRAGGHCEDYFPPRPGS